MSEIRNAIASIAKAWEGQKEVPGNMGFQDKMFEKLMEAVGFQAGQAWCAYFAELVWRKAFEKMTGIKMGSGKPGDLDHELNILFSAGAVSTWNNFVKGGWRCNSDADVGCVAIWQNYKGGHVQWTGHAGIVISKPAVILDDKGRVRFNIGVLTIEGNSNGSGGREGIEVAGLQRSAIVMSHGELLKNQYTGLALKGFIHPIKK